MGRKKEHEKIINGINSINLLTHLALCDVLQYGQCGLVDIGDDEVSMQ